MICFTIKKFFDIGLDIRGSNSNIFENMSHCHDFRHRNFEGCSRVVSVLCFERQTYNHSDNGECALISPNVETRTIIWGRSEYLLRPPIGMLPKFRSYDFRVS